MTKYRRTTSVLTVEEMYRADAAAAASGVSGVELMENAGRAVADAIGLRWSPRPVLVLCGPGNNGGDGFVLARHLKARGWPVRLALLGERKALKGDAATHAARWDGAVEPLAGRPAAEILGGAGLVVDALFGAGLSRPLEGGVAELLQAAQDSRLPLVAVDVPSGLDGDTGRPRGFTPQAALTVTFAAAKPGHLLLPGRSLCGRLVVANIGFPPGTIERIGPRQWRNGPALWAHLLPSPGPSGHKYGRGHALVLGGAVMTGAARLAATAAARAGAGLVTVAAPPEAWPVYASALAGVIVEPADWRSGPEAPLADPRRNAVLVGPGAGASEATRQATLAALDHGRAVAIDADAITAAAGDAEALFRATSGRPVVLTPHAGEFARLFPDLAKTGGKLGQARAAAARSGCVVLLKGGDTVIAAPDGRAAIETAAPAWLATAGSGDVLAGILLGFMAQGMPVFEAAAAAVWVHGQAACRHGPGLVADDLPGLLPGVLRELHDAG